MSFGRATKWLIWLMCWPASPRRARCFARFATPGPTTTPHGRLMLTVLGGLAEFERELIRSSTSEGRERAKARGVKLGRRHGLTVAQRTFVAQQRANGESVRHLARVLWGSKATIGRIPPSEA